MYICTSMCGHQKSKSGVLLYRSLQRCCCRHRQDSSLTEPKAYQLSSRLARGRDPHICLTSHSVPITGWAHYTQLTPYFALYMGAGNLNSGPLACTKSPASTKEFLSRVSAAVGWHHQALLKLQCTSKLPRDKFKFANHWMRFCCIYLTL